jgi:uncharacterized protein YkwD
MKTRLLAFAMLFITAAALADPLTYTAPSRSEITPETVLEQMNAERAGRGLGPLRIDSRLSEAAHDRMADMEDLGYWAHQSPDGRSPFSWLSTRDYPFANAGENLASGFETAEVLVSSWMESPGHRDNIVSPLYQDCGIAIIDGATTRRAAGKSIVVLFARPLVRMVPTTTRTARNR